MKSKILYSRYSAILTSIIILGFFVGLIATYNEKTEFFILLAIYLILIGSSLLYGVAYLQVDAHHIILGSILRKQRILMRDVQSVDKFQPTMGAIRIWASGGFMGYWGLFREGDIGRYYAFYGKSSDCFLLRMKNGDKYVLGCKAPEKMISFIRNHINLQSLATQPKT